MRSAKPPSQSAHKTFSVMISDRTRTAGKAPAERRGVGRLVNLLCQYGIIKLSAVVVFFFYSWKWLLSLPPKKKWVVPYWHVHSYGYLPARISYSITTTGQSHLRPALWANAQEWFKFNELIVSPVLHAKITRVGIFLCITWSPRSNIRGGLLG